MPEERHLPRNSDEPEIDDTDQHSRHSLETTVKHEPLNDDAPTHEPLNDDAPSHTLNLESTSRGSCSSGRKRGIAKGVPRPTIEAERYHVTISHGKAIGPNKDKFITKIGIWVKDQTNFPFWQRDFNSFPQSKWEDMSRATKEFFDIEIEGDFISFLKHNTRKTWNDARSKLYRENYEIYEHHEAIQRVPHGMSAENWTRVCEDIFSQPHWGKKSERNTENRKRKLVMHISLIQRREDLQSDSSRNPKHKETLAEGDVTNSHTQEVMMNELMERSRETSRTLGEDPISREVIGSGSKSRDYFKCRDLSHTELQAELSATKAQLSAIQSKYDALIEEKEQMVQAINGIHAGYAKLSEILFRNSYPPFQMPYGAFLPPAPPHPTHPPHSGRPPSPPHMAK